MIRPLLQEEAFLADVRAADVPDDAFRMWWLGQSGFLVQYQGAHLLLDPYLSDSLTRKYANTDKPHVRMTERVVDPGRLDFIRVATTSHNHTDHLDAGTLIPLLAANPTMCIVAPAANREFAVNRLQCDPERLIGIEDGESTFVPPFRFTAVPAAHEEVSPEYHGYIVEFGPWCVYHSGDTLLYPDMVQRLRAFSIDVALLPINGRAPERRVAGNLDGAEAAQLARDIGAKLVIPCHYEMFEFNTAEPDLFTRTCRTIGQPFQLLRAGERWDSWHLT